jgi:hypothetical protein
MRHGGAVKRRWGLAAFAWVVAAVLTTGVGIAAVESLGDGILGSPEKPLTRGDVTDQLARSPRPSTTAPLPSDLPSLADSPSPSDSPSGPATAASSPSRLLASDGGTVVASCDGALVTLLSWSPAQGYRVVKVERGPAKIAEIRFSDGDGHEDHADRLRVFCRNGRPEAVAGEDDKAGHD